MLAPFHGPQFSAENSLEISRKLAEIFEKRRTIRQYSSEIPPEEIIYNAIDVARFSPSGANRQPWEFCLVKSPELKSRIRGLAEKEERDFYIDRPNQTWIDDLKHLHTNEEKAFLTEAPYLIIIFYKHFDMDESGEKSINYYAKESVGIATGMLISALHLSGLSCLTYTPRRMQFLTQFLDRTKEERPFLVLGVGLAHDEAQVPVIEKKALDEVLSSY